MREIHLFIAMSLDGCIADPQGGVDWLRGQGEPTAADPDPYGVFIQGIDTVLMGWNTYHQIVTQLSPDAWPYPDQTTYVFTHRDCPDAPGLRFVHSSPAQLVRQLRQQPGRDIWVCGGAQLVHQLLEADLVDRFYITVIPTLLGEGVRLFAPTGKALELELVSTQSYNGMVDLAYRRRTPRTE